MAFHLSEQATMSPSSMRRTIPHMSPTELDVLLPRRLMPSPLRSYEPDVVASDISPVEQRQRQRHHRVRVRLKGRRTPVGRALLSRRPPRSRNQIVIDCKFETHISFSDFIEQPTHRPIQAPTVLDRMPAIDGPLLMPRP